MIIQKLFSKLTSICQRKTRRLNVTNILPFKFEENEIRVVTDEKGEPWFAATDVCKIIGIQNPSDAITRLEDDEKDGIDLVGAIGRSQKNDNNF